MPVRIIFCGLVGILVSSSYGCFTGTTIGIRASGVVTDSYDATVDAGPISISGETEYESYEVGLVVSSISSGRSKSSTNELLIGKASFGDLDAVEYAIGGRYFFAPGSALPIYWSLHLVATNFDDVAGSSVGTQLGARYGLGVEIPIGDSGAYFDVHADYTHALVAADDSTSLVDTEVDGLAVRAGFGWDL